MLKVKNAVMKDVLSRIRFDHAARSMNRMRHVIIKYPGTYNKQRIAVELSVNVLQVDVLFTNPAILGLSVDVCSGAYSVASSVQPC